jgi:hypothetical protein
MRQMPRAARIYLVNLYILGLIAFGWLIVSHDEPITRGDIILGIGLAIVSAICQIFLVVRTNTAGQRSDHLTLASLFAALVLLPTPLLALLIIITFLPEWYFYRRSWFGQVFNIAAFLIAATLALLAFYAVTGQYLHSTPGLFTTSWTGTLTLILVFELMQATMLACVLKLARGQSLQTSGLFTVDSLLLEFGLICLGLCFAISWMIGPLFGLAAAMPLILIFQALHVPNLKEDLTESYEATVQALSRALDTRDEETEEHSQRVRRYTELVARRLHISEAELNDISYGAVLHDIGKIGVPDAILLKPGKLTDDERTMIRKHPEIGYHMIAHIPFLARAALVVLHHHESYDGTGYPRGLTSEQIPLGARMFAIADTFDAMTSDRPYRRGLPIEDACEEIKRCRGTQFDPKLVDIFLSIPVMELTDARESTRRPTTSLEIEETRPVEPIQA